MVFIVFIIFIVIIILSSCLQPLLFLPQSFLTKAERGRASVSRRQFSHPFCMLGCSGKTAVAKGSALLATPPPPPPPGQVVVDSLVMTMMAGTHAEERLNKLLGGQEAPGEADSTGENGGVASNWNEEAGEGSPPSTSCDVEKFKTEQQYWPCWSYDKEYYKKEEYKPGEYYTKEEYKHGEYYNKEQEHTSWKYSDKEQEYKHGEYYDKEQEYNHGEYYKKEQEYNHGEYYDKQDENLYNHGYDREYSKKRKWDFDAEYYDKKKFQYEKPVVEVDTKASEKAAEPQTEAAGSDETWRRFVVDQACQALNHGDVDAIAADEAVKLIESEMQTHKMEIGRLRQNLRIIKGAPEEDGQQMQKKVVAFARKPRPSLTSSTMATLTGWCYSPCKKKESNFMQSSTTAKNTSNG